PAALAGLRLAGALHWFWGLGGRVGEGRRWLTEGLAWGVGEGECPARARALLAAGTLNQVRGSDREAPRVLGEGATVAERMNDPITTGRCLTFRSIIESYFAGTGELDVGVTRATATRAVSLLETTPDAWGQALIASQIGTDLRRSGQYQQS